MGSSSAALEEEETSTSRRVETVHRHALLKALIQIAVEIVWMASCLASSLSPAKFYKTESSIVD